MGDLAWTRRNLFGFPAGALHLHAIALGTSGSGKTETLLRIAYGARKIYGQQVIYLDAKGESKRDEEARQDNAARFLATMLAAGATSLQVFPATHYDGWHGTPTELKNRLLSVIDFSESAYYGDVAANALDLALSAPTTPRSSGHFLANLGLDRLKAIYQNDPTCYRRVLALDKRLLQQVEMRYQVFFAAMAGQLDGSLDYANLDAAYLRVRGFTLRDEAPRLGRFLVADFMHYMAERRRSGVQTLLIIDEFNALRMREETSILFEQVRSFGGNLLISAQGYSGLGPKEYAERMLDSCSTYILHACSDPGPVSRRAGKKFSFEVSWTEDEEGTPRKHIRPRYDWRVPEERVIQQEEGQAFWIYRGRAQQVQTAMVPITAEQVREGWREIHREEEKQRAELEMRTRQKLQTKKKMPAASTDNKQGQPDAASHRQLDVFQNATHKKKSQHAAAASKRQQVPENAPLATAAQSPMTESVSTVPTPPSPPALELEDDDEPDRL
jgi:hypothetical protein